MTRLPLELIRNRLVLTRLPLVLVRFVHAQPDTEKGTRFPKIRGGGGWNESNRDESLLVPFFKVRPCIRDLRGKVSS